MLNPETPLVMPILLFAGAQEAVKREDEAFYE